MATNWAGFSFSLPLLSAACGPFLQVMPPFDPEMVEPLHAHMRSKGCALHLGDGVAGFEPGPEGRGLVVKTQGGKAHPADLVMLVRGQRLAAQGPRQGCGGNCRAAAMPAALPSLGWQ